MSPTRNKLARAAVLAAAFAIAFTVSKATDREPRAAAVPVSIAPKAANPGVTGLGSPASIPRLLPQTKSEAPPSDTAPPAPDTSPTQPPSGPAPYSPSPPAPQPQPQPQPQPGPPDPGPSGVGGESQSGSL
jgi:hypothetical protein